MVGYLRIHKFALMRNKKLLAVIGIAITLPISAALAFTDTVGHTNEEAIEYLYEEGIIEGYGNDLYAPDNKINRAEFTKILMESRYPHASTGSDCFDDVGDDWYARYICMAKDLGIVEGYGDGTFGPATYINLAEALKVVIETYDVEFTQYSEDWLWYVPYQRTAEDIGMLDYVYSDVADEIDRGEMAQLIYNVEDYLGDIEISDDWADDEEEIVCYLSDEEETYFYGDADDVDSDFSIDHEYEVLSEDYCASYAEYHYGDEDDEVEDVVYEIPSYDAPDPLENTITNNDNCDQNTYRSAVILLEHDGHPTNEEQERADLIRGNLPYYFAEATKYLGRMNVDDLILMDLEEEMINRDDEGEIDSLDESAVVENFYETHDDIYDFIIIFVSFEMNDVGTHIAGGGIREIEGLGLPDAAFNTYSSTYDSAKLRGVIQIGRSSFIEDEMYFPAPEKGLLHEIGHAWCCNLGEDFSETVGYTIHRSSHYAYVLDGPDGELTLMGSYAWQSNGDGTFSMEDADDESWPSVSYTYHPFTLYFMGLLPEHQYDDDYYIYDVWQESPSGEYTIMNIESATYFGKINVNDIIDFAGERYCIE